MNQKTHSHEKVIIPVPKLMNMGNTCYLNAVLQMFFNIPELTDFFSKSYTKSGKKFADSYKDLIEGVIICTNNHEHNGKRIVPLSFKKMLNEYITSFRGTTQQDSSECLIYMIEYLYKEIGQKSNLTLDGEYNTTYELLQKKALKTWINEFKDHYSPLLNLLYGTQISIIKCLGCHKKFPKFDVISIISIEIPQNSKDTTTELKNCLENYFGPEIIKDWTCEKCKHKGGEKRLWLWKKPKYLIFHIKRFNNNGTKINTNINFPIINLDTTPYIFPDNKNTETKFYNLCNVIYHYGRAYGGHYTGASKKENNWYICNDDSIEIATKTSEIVNQHSYILMYHAI